MPQPNATRRQVLKIAAALAGIGVGAPFALNLAAMANASAATSGSGYRGIVYVNLGGGNDGQNVVLATDPTSWTTYQQYRDTSATDGANSIYLPASTLLNIAPANAYGGGVNAGRTFAFHPNLPNLQALFQAKRAAVVANVGPLIAPLSAAQYKAGSAPIPQNLYSHNSQTATWQAFDGSQNKFGWGGRLGDLLMAQNAAATFTCISVGGGQLFLQGEQIVSVEANYSGLPAIAGLLQNQLAATSVFPASGEGTDVTTTVLNKILTQPRSDDYFANDLITTTNRSIAAQQTMAQNLVASVPVPPANNGLASQFAAILRIMASNAGLGVSRQVFYAQLGGFDMHDGEVLRHQALLSEFDAAVAYFDTAVTALGLSQNAVMFTGSEFGRTFTSNGDGTDHGWGNHHFVIGGPVRGGDIYGTFPTLGVNNASNVGAALLPAISVDQYAATFATWLGVPPGSLGDVFPNLGNFASTNLGFLST